jgi:hypothetical protein
MASVATLVLLVTGWGSAVAGSVQSVIVANTASNPVPVAATGTVPVHEQGTAKVAEQNVDGNGNIKVHEQGTANVNVTNTTAVPVNGSVSISGTPSVNANVSQSPITSGAAATECSSGASPCMTGSGTVTASALEIAMTGGVVWCTLELTDLPDVTASFIGPASGGPATVVLPLSRPISFDRLDVSGLSDGDTCHVDSVGDSP